jgi:hypothetical protein
MLECRNALVGYMLERGHAYVARCNLEIQVQDVADMAGHGQPRNQARIWADGGGRRTGAERGRRAGAGRWALAALGTGAMASYLS